MAELDKAADNTGIQLSILSPFKPLSGPFTVVDDAKRVRAASAEYGDVPEGFESVLMRSSVDISSSRKVVCMSVRSQVVEGDRTPTSINIVWASPAL